MAEREWPLPWLEVAGDRGGALQYVQYLLYRGAVGAGSRLPLTGRRAMSLALGSIARTFDRSRARAARASSSRRLIPSSPSASVRRSSSARGVT